MSVRYHLCKALEGLVPGKCTGYFFPTRTLFLNAELPFSTDESRPQQTTLKTPSDRFGSVLCLELHHDRCDVRFGGTRCNFQ
ncbi:hypothetical protein CA13_46480 [Planctomycetes bacterium CA13]|uniref:Uncharacterized protein n=1 Tax=Novipirellula herctigrandis TaxID=2527986 RepID=A0A5C5Z7G9_9BACT|nr:hypothetical protein CA13_46480 [Planctomycetes bacterium CA13]